MDTYRLCPTCRSITSATGNLFCAKDGARLQDDLRILAGKFILLRKLGQGGMGAVWLAEQPSMARNVAIKILLPNLASDSTFLRRFEREARAAGQLNHPNIVTLYETGQDGDQCYLAMEYLSGETLAQLLQREPRQSLRRALALWLPVARAMAVAHRQRVVHRDLKPENIFLSPPVTGTGTDLLVKVLDFGIAKLQGAAISEKATLAGASIGSPLYMAPEQFGSAEDVDDRADVFSLGVILYEMLAGQRPYQGYSIALTVRQAPPLHDLCSDVPRDLSTLINRMLAMQPGDRPSIIEVVAAMPGLDEPAGEVPRAGGVPSRWRLGRVAGAAACVGACGTLFLLLATRDAPLPDAVSAQRERALEVLKESLTASNPTLRAEAAGAIGQCRDPQLHALLTPRLGDPAAEVRAEAAVGLGQLGAQVDAAALMQVAERDPVPIAQVAAAGALLRLHRPEGPTVLRHALTGPDDDARLLAALRLDESGDGAARQLLKSWLERRTLPLKTRLRILPRLSQGGDEAATAELSAMITGSPGPQLIIAAGSLARSGDVRARALLAKTAGQGGPQQLLAARLLAALGDASGYDLFRGVLKDPKQALAARVLAAEGLAASGRREGVMVLWPVLGPKAEPHLRVAAAGALLRLAEDDPDGVAARSLDWAREALGDRQWSVRNDAVSVLGDIEAETSVVLLGQALRDENAEVRHSAARALGRKQVRLALQQLQPGLEDSDGEVRRSVIQAIGQVAVYLKGRGDVEAGRSVLGRLSAMARSGSSIDAVVASGTLLRLGDGSQRDVLQKGLRSVDARVRRLALELGGADSAALLHGLTDPDLLVRFSAARLLAEGGRRESMVVLREVLAQGNVNGLLAYGLLRKLGETPIAPSGLRSLLVSGDLETRTAAVEALVGLPAEEATPLLRQALLDSVAVVRRQVAEVAFELARLGRPEGWELLSVLRGDDEVSVRSRAGTLLVRLGPRPLVAAVNAPVARSAPPDMATSTPPDMTTPLVFKRGPALSPPSPSPLPEQFLKDSEVALGQRDYRKALQLLNRAEELAGGAKRGGLRAQIWMEKGRVFEARNRWDQALDEYSKLLQVPPAQRSKAEAAAVAQLATRFGRLVVSQAEGSKCQTTEKWARPGASFIHVGGQMLPVNVRAGEVKRVQSCQ